MTKQDPTPAPPAQAQDKSLFHDAPVASVLLTPDGRILDLNTLAYGLLDLPREPQEGRRFASLLPSAVQSTFSTFLKQVAAGAGPQTIETQVTRRDKTTLDLRLDLGASTTDGQLTHFHLVLTDITPYKQAHQVLLDGHAALDQQIESGTARLRALNEELDQVVTAVIQELYVPASRVMSAVGLLRQALGDRLGGVEKPVLHVERGGQQLLTIIHSVERYMQARRFRTRLRTVDLRHVLRDVRQRSAPLLADRQVQFTHDPLPTLLADSQALTIILEEYLANALKYTRNREEARIHLHVRELEGEYVFGVEDNGVGFNMRHKDRLFQLFQRQHSSSVYEGSGLGLAVVRRVAERFGGRAWGEGTVERGATFWFAWPKQPRIHE